MSAETDLKLKRLFAAYAPALVEEPFLAKAREAIARQQRLRRTRSAAIYSTIVLVGGCIAFASSPIVDGWFSLLHDGLVRWTDAFSPLVSQLLTYGIAGAVAILGRRRIRAFLAPW